MVLTFIQKSKELDKGNNNINISKQLHFILKIT